MKVDISHRELTNEKQQIKLQKVYVRSQHCMKAVLSVTSLFIYLFLFYVLKSATGFFLYLTVRSLNLLWLLNGFLKENLSSLVCLYTFNKSFLHHHHHHHHHRHHHHHHHKMNV